MEIPELQRGVKANLPMIVETTVAAQTTTLKVGRSVILLPLHNQVHLANDVITLELVVQHL